jgi:anti-sigma factor RsiW
MSASIDGELRPSGRERLAGHLERCAACRAQMARLEQVHALFTRAERFGPRPGLSLRVLAAARQPERSRRRLFPAPVRVLARVAAFTAVVAVGVVSGNLLADVPGPGGAASPAALASLEIFAAAPPDSPGGVYLAMLGDARD